MKPLAIASTLALAAGANAGILVTQLDSDAEFEMGTQGIAFEAEGRIGDATTTGMHEFGLGANRDTPTDTDQFGWVSGATIPFSLEYDFDTRGVTFTTPSGTLSYTASGAPAFGISFRTFATNGTVFLDDLFVNGSDLPVGVLSTGGAPDVSHLLVIDDIGGFGDISVSGVATLTFDEPAPPTGSELAFQIIGFVPAPSAVEIER